MARQSPQQPPALRWTDGYRDRLTSELWEMSALVRAWRSDAAAHGDRGGGRALPRITPWWCGALEEAGCRVGGYNLLPGRNGDLYDLTLLVHATGPERLPAEVVGQLEMTYLWCCGSRLNSAHTAVTATRITTFLPPRPSASCSRWASRPAAVGVIAASPAVLGWPLDAYADPGAASCRGCSAAPARSGAGCKGRSTLLIAGSRRFVPSAKHAHHRDHPLPATSPSSSPSSHRRPSIPAHGPTTAAA